jgi:hypothetical protein
MRQRLSRRLARVAAFSTSNLKFAAGGQEFRVRCTKEDPAVVPQTRTLVFGEPAANFGFGVLGSQDWAAEVSRTAADPQS